MIIGHLASIVSAEENLKLMKRDVGDNYFENERNNRYVTIYEERLICLVEKT